MSRRIGYQFVGSQYQPAEFLVRCVLATFWMPAAWVSADEFQGNSLQFCANVFAGSPDGSNGRIAGV
jgi:hypothetical protein